MKISASISVQYDNIFSPFSGAQWEDGFCWCKEQGFDGVELILADPNLLDVDKLAAALVKYSLEVSTVSTGQATGMEGLGMCSAAEYIREATFRRLKDDIDFSTRLGRPNVTVGLIRGVGGVQSRELEYALLLREMQRIAEYADKQGVVINFEPINRYECKLCNSTADGRRLIEDMGTPKNVGILYDTFHSNIEDVDMQKAISENLPYISHVHLADSNRRLPGEGHVDFPMVFRTLKNAGYQGYASLEVLNNPSAAHVREFAGKQILDIYRGIRYEKNQL